MRRLWTHTSAAPKELLAAKARLSAAAVDLARAKPENDFALFAEPFAELLA